ncbi:ABC transporter ATP-binding protein [Pseudonocardia asaccharolytica]|uniref:ABC transporter ATP-binding protein n=1 Tax=Pseudonocardia asaccharolytica DSM 44247 = NBRC 16224 TaxID=1123024 RepID=A0A511D4V3_9PSEU|nr:ABC transporter ATP-binding protein [Pseudonocardia asaccharolytica]GEL19826.1 ABC transporter ATP-binding protein [Pseudonocardia asaccharolytica DSM 44247 = NBRC 16224]
MTNQPAAEVRELVKRYPKSPTNAVDGLSFTVERGEVFGLLGPNGAGKTTTVGVLTTRVLPTGGSARVTGLDVVADAVAVRSRLAVVPQRVNLDRSLSVRDNLIFHAAYHGVGRAERNCRADALLDRMGLQDKAKAVVDDLSGGQSQRVMIARGLMHRPEVLFLDEPSTGLDPQARLFVHDQVRELRDEGVTIVLTTHDMDEAQKLSDRVGIVDHGKLLTLDTPGGLIRSLPGCGTVEVTVAPGTESADELVARLIELPGVERVEQLAAAPPSGVPSDMPPIPNGPGRIAAPPAPAGVDRDIRLRLYVDTEPAALVGPVVALLGSHDAQVSDLSLGEPSLEDIFISLTGRDLR